MKKFLVLTLAAAFLQAPISAQAPIQVTTRLVQVAVVVRDKHGAVGDLSKNDFEIQDKGKPRKIATFSIARASQLIPNSTLPPNTFSNRLNQHTDAPVTATAILFDRLNTSFVDQAIVRGQTADFLKSIDKVGPIAVYSLDNELRLLHDFTEDRSRLTSALAREPNQNSILLADPVPIATGSGLGLGSRKMVEQPLQAYTLDQRASITLAAMEAIANHLAGAPGRKNLIWISDGFPLTISFGAAGLNGGGPVATVSYAEQMRLAAAAIDRANVAVYPVDARGLVVDGYLQSPLAGPRQRALPRRGNLQAPPELVAGSNIDTMLLLADWTGGRAFFNTNDISGAMLRAAEDSEITYTLGFYADEQELDGTYHELKVKVARKGADVRYRKGYFATPLAAATTQADANALWKAIVSPADATAIGLTAVLQPATAPSEGFLLSLVAEIPDLSGAANDSRWSDTFRFEITQVGGNGRILSAIKSAVKFNVTDENREALLRNGMAVKIGVVPVAGMSQIRVAVMDQATGNVGSLRIVPPAKP